MGMFDHVNYECICPVCKSKVDDFQTKDGDCILEVVEPTSVHNFYANCNKCGSWIEFRSKPATNFIRTVKGKKDGRRVYLSEHTKEVSIG